MSDDHAAAPNRQAVAVRGRSLPGRVSGRLKIALDEMIWSGVRRADAAAKAGMTDHSLRAAMKKPHVLAHFRAELAALRESEKARNLHRLAEIRDSDRNQMASVQAVRTLEALTDEAGAADPRHRPPGLTIVINQSPGTAAPPQTITIDHDPSVGTDMGRRDEGGSS